MDPPATPTPSTRARWPSLSVRGTLLLTIVVAVVLPALLVGGVDSWLSRRTYEPMIDRNRGAVMVLGAAVMTEPAWTLSEAGLQAAARRILDEPSVCSVSVLDLQPTRGPMTMSLNRCPDATVGVAREAPVQHEGQQIARLRVVFDGGEIDRVVAQRHDFMFWLVAGQAALALLVPLGVLSLRLLRPIDHLKARASAIVARTPLPQWPFDRADELGELADHLDDVHQRSERLFEELETKNAQLHQLAMYDQLTGLPNRRLFEDLFHRHAALAQRTGDAMALLFVDLDHFKDVNDSHGHAAGDILLTTAADRLRGALRQGDVVCRLGGDEFVVLLAQAQPWEAVAQAARRLLAAVEAPFALPGGDRVRLSASIGIALLPHDGDDLDTLMRHADLAMYAAKDSGRARYSFFHPDLRSSLHERMATEAELVRAIEADELVLHYQPIVDAVTQQVRGLEALSRWQHPSRGLLSPAAFIGLAESTGLIRELGRGSIERACAQMARWAAAGPAAARVAVNLSPLQLRDQQLPERVREALQRHGIAPSALELELTETTVMAEGPATADVLARLRALGVHLVLDDFGTGHSSLAVLKRLRPDKLKIDRAFVRPLPGGADDQALIRAMVGMARALRIEIVAEGVETPEQRQALLDLGCRLQQGYLYGRPQPPAERAPEWIERRDQASAG